MLSRRSTTTSAKAGPVMIKNCWSGMRSRICALDGGSAGHGPVADEGDSAGGVVDAVAFAAAVPQDVPPPLHVREGVLDAGADTFMDGDELLPPPGEFTATGRTPVGHDDLTCRFPW